MRWLLTSITLALIAGCATPRHVAQPALTHADTPASKADVARYAEQLLADNYAADGPGAAVIVAHGDDVLFRGARGMGDVEHATTLAADDLFEIASITKQFAAAALLKLVEAGKVSLDDPLSKYVKDYPGGDRISVLELLNHTSGIKEYTDTNNGRADAGTGKSRTTAQLIDSFKNEKADFVPGAGWAYSNSGYVLVGAVIEAASGLPWYEYVQRTLLLPLGLTHTGSGADPAFATRQVHGYILVDGKPMPGQLQDMTPPDGGLVSSVDDLLKWNRALHEGRVLKTDSYRRMIEPVGQAVLEHYGLGLWHTTLRGRAMLGHSGWLSGFTAYLLYLPDSRISVVVLENIDRAAGVADPRAIARKLAAFAIGDPYPVPTPFAADATSLQQVEGRYGIDLPGSSLGRVQGARVLRVIDAKLTAARTGDDRSDLIPIATDTFQSRDSFDRLHFERDAVGAVSGMRFFPWGEGEGLVFARTAALPPLIGLSRAALERVTGTYSAGGFDVRVFVDGGQLKAQPAGQPASALLAESPDLFVVALVDAELEFTPAQGVAQKAILRQGSAAIEFKRKL